jgi:hypothetical protein
MSVSSLSRFAWLNPWYNPYKILLRLLILQVLTYNVLSFKMTTNRDERKAWFLQISATLFESVIFWNWCIEDSKIVDMQYIRIVNIREYICFESFLKGRTYLGTSSGIIWNLSSCTPGDIRAYSKWRAGVC